MEGVICEYIYKNRSYLYVCHHVLGQPCLQTEQQASVNTGSVSSTRETLSLPFALIASAPQQSIEEYFANPFLMQTSHEGVTE
jgi:hypothetical protein